MARARRAKPEQPEGDQKPARDLGPMFHHCLGLYASPAFRRQTWPPARPVRNRAPFPCLPTLTGPDGVNVVHPNNRLQLAVTGNPHLDEDSYVSKRWHRSGAPMRIA